MCDYVYACLCRFWGTVTTFTCHVLCIRLGSVSVSVMRYCHYFVTSHAYDWVEESDFVTGGKMPPLVKPLYLFINLFWGAFYPMYRRGHKTLNQQVGHREREKKRIWNAVSGLNVIRAGFEYTGKSFHCIRKSFEWKISLNLFAWRTAATDLPRVQQIWMSTKEHNERDALKMSFKFTAMSVQQHAPSTRLWYSHKHP